MNDLTINKLKTISQQCYKILYDDYSEFLELKEDRINIDNKLTKENFKNFLDRVKLNNSILDVQDYLIKNLREIKEIFKDDIQMIFPFYSLCDIQISKNIEYLTVTVKIDYYYDEKIKHYNEAIPLNENVEKHIARLEAYLNLLRVLFEFANDTK